VVPPGVYRLGGSPRGIYRSDRLNGRSTGSGSISLVAQHPALKLLEALEDLDDIQEVYTNASFPAEVRQAAV